MIQYERPKYDNLIITESNRSSEKYHLEDGEIVILPNIVYSWVWDIPEEYWNVEYLTNIQNIEWNIIYRPDVVESLIKPEGGERKLFPYVEYKKGNSYSGTRIFQIRHDWEIQDIRYGKRQLVQVYGRFASTEVSGNIYKSLGW